MIRALAALLLLAGTAGAQFPTTPNLGLSLGTDARMNGNLQALDAAICPGSSASACANATSGGGGGGGGLGINVVNFGALPNGGDVTTQLNAATASRATVGGTINLPAGTYTTTAPVRAYSGQVIQGEGCAFDGVNWFGTILRMTGPTGYSGIASATPSVCTGVGAGACDGLVGGGNRGTGCPCYSGADCTSTTCGSGTAVRGVVVRNLCLDIQSGGSSAGVDLLGISEADVSDLFIFADSTTATEVDGVRLSDSNGALSGYSNSVHNIRMGGAGAAKVMSVGVRVMPQANNSTVREIRILGNVGVGIQTDPSGIGQPALNTHVEDNAIETFTTAAILDKAKGTQIAGNYCESGGALNLPCLHLDHDTSVQIGYNFFTPSTLTQPVLYTIPNGPVSMLFASNMIDTGKWANSFDNFKFLDFPYQNRTVAPFSCQPNQVGRIYYNSVQHSLCRCDNFGGTDKWCPVACDTTPSCPGAFLCGAAQTASTCG